MPLAERQLPPPVKIVWATGKGFLGQNLIRYLEARSVIPSSFSNNTYRSLLDMAPTIVHLPNGQTFTVSPVFAGLSFKANDLNIHHSIFPPGWTIILESEDDPKEKDSNSSPETDNDEQLHLPKRARAHRFKTPTLQNDTLFLSSISNPSSVDFKPATSPTRQIAMMLWATLFWYFHQVLGVTSLGVTEILIRG